VADRAAAELAGRVSAAYELIPGSIYIRVSDPAVDLEAVTCEVDALGEQRLVDMDAPAGRSPVMCLAVLTLLAAILFVASFVLVVR
jgi:hypothetical protein